MRPPRHAQSPMTSCRSAAILRRTARNAGRGDGADDTDPARPLCSPAAATDLVARTTAELHTNAHSRQWGGMTGPHGR